jgi:hypothetical protein
MSLPLLVEAIHQLYIIKERSYYFLLASVALAQTGYRNGEVENETGICQRRPRLREDDGACCGG